MRRRTGTIATRATRRMSVGVASSYIHGAAKHETTSAEENGRLNTSTTVPMVGSSAFQRRAARRPRQSTASRMRKSIACRGTRGACCWPTSATRARPAPTTSRAAAAVCSTAPAQIPRSQSGEPSRWPSRCNRSDRAWAVRLKASSVRRCSWARRYWARSSAESRVSTRVRVVLMAATMESIWSSTTFGAPAAAEASPERAQLSPRLRRGGGPRPPRGGQAPPVAGTAGAQARGPGALLLHPARPLRQRVVPVAQLRARGLPRGAELLDHRERRAPLQTRARLVEASLQLGGLSWERVQDRLHVARRRDRRVLTVEQPAQLGGAGRHLGERDRPPALRRPRRPRGVARGRPRG